MYEKIKQLKDKVLKSKYKLGLALSGGGARGFAHVGALQAMLERGMKPDIISGTSAGSIAGALYADGYAPEEILEMFGKLKIMGLTEFTLPKEGLFKTTKLYSFLRKNLRAKTFEDLNIPFCAIATDIEKGKSCAFREGDLVPAIVASCSIPIVFTPMEIGGRHYVDGGLFANFPVSVIRGECKTIVGVNVSPTVQRPYSPSIKYVVERTFNALTTSNAFLDRKLCDILIESPDVSHYTMYDLEYAADIYRLGYETTVGVLDGQGK